MTRSPLALALFGLLLTAVFLPATAHADCPTRADLPGGIAFTGPEGEREEFADIGDGMVSASYRYPNGFRTEALLWQGVFLMELLDLVGTEGETRTSYTFPMDTAEIALPKPGGSWDVIVSVTDGRHSVSERQLYSYGDPEEHSYGECSYEVIPFTAEYSTVPDTVETYHYLPALGLSYLYTVVDPSGTQVYPYTRIEALR
ncbi:MAG: hypothetical protein CSA74_09065 [Rhodobacterales bacterium]|nr:MAG: hypothetical protein CSA74_09065 [Rhodobacterales bacterium]